MKNLLVVADEIGTRESLRAVFQDTYQVIVAETGDQALELVTHTHVDLVILDLVSPSMPGLTFLRHLRAILPDVPVILVSSFFNDPTIQEARQLRIVGFICKPFDIHEIRTLTTQTLRAADASRQQQLLNQEISLKFPVNIIGESPAIRRVMEAAKAASQGSAPVLILGEPGLGREHLARQIHSWGLHRSEPFIKIDPNRSEAHSLETELFGSVLNAITHTVKPGVIDLISAGSIYLNELQRFPVEAQRRIQHAIQHREFQRPGAEGQSVPHIGRFFASCPVEPHSTLIPELTPLFSAHTIIIPPLRERPDDIPILATHYLSQLRLTLNARTASIDPQAMVHLQQYRWPGNVRELRNVIERTLFVHGHEPVIQSDHLPKEISGALLPVIDPEVISFQDATDQLHRQMIRTALKRSDGVVKNAASLLRVTPRILQHRIDRLQIDLRDV